MPLPPLQKPKRKKYKGKGRSPHLQGKEFESEVAKSLRFCKEEFSGDFYFQRLYDTKSYVSHNPLIQIPRQPADYFALYKGQPYFLEAKSSKVPNTYRISYVKDTQIESLLEVEKAGAKSYLLMCRKIPRRNRLFYLPIQVFVALKREAEDDNRKSLHWSDIRELGQEIRLVKGRRKLWDLRPLFRQ